MRLCSIPNCTGKHVARGYCVPHWRRWKLHGDPLGAGCKHLWKPRNNFVVGPIGFVQSSNGDYFLVDADDFDKAIQYPWSSMNGYAKTLLPGRKKMRLHHLVIGHAPEGYVCDHENRIPSDYRRKNLRFIPKAKNMHNVSLACNNSSGYKGVAPYRNGKWQSYINIAPRKRKSLGIFPQIEDAVAARQEAERQYYQIVALHS